MGGTTAKAVIVENGRPSMTSEYEFRDGMSTSSRFIKAGGYMLKVPAIDLAEVGAGGGSLASVDAGGLLTVGPQSAGADPGPGCYGLGNTSPTVTDANVVLGFINPSALAGGQLADRAAPERTGHPRSRRRRRSASRWKMPRTASAPSPTRRWRARSAPSASSAAATRAISPSSQWAAMAAFTRSTSRANLVSSGSSFRCCQAYSAPSACWRATSRIRACGRCCVRWPT